MAGEPEGDGEAEAGALPAAPADEPAELFERADAELYATKAGRSGSRRPSGGEDPLGWTGPHWTSTPAATVVPLVPPTARTPPPPPAQRTAQETSHPPETIKNYYDWAFRFTNTYEHS